MPVNGQCLRCVRLRCESNGRDPENCPVSDILDFLQQRMDDGSMPSTLKVYVAAILAFTLAGWTLQNTFARFYNLDMWSLASQVLLVNTTHGSTCHH